MEVDDSLVDPHLELVPGLTTLSARSLTGGDSQGLGGHPHGSLHLQLLVLGSLDQVTADLLQGLDVAGSQSDPDAVDGSVLLHTFSILNMKCMRYTTLNNISNVERLLSKLLLLSEVLANPSHDNFAKLERHQIIENIVASIEVLLRTI